jgi:hypothetical protein
MSRGEGVESRSLPSAGGPQQGVRAHPVGIAAGEAAAVRALGGAMKSPAAVATTTAAAAAAATAAQVGGGSQGEGGSGDGGGDGSEEATRVGVRRRLLGVSPRSPSASSGARAPREPNRHGMAFTPPARASSGRPLTHRPPAAPCST